MLFSYQLHKLQPKLKQVNLVKIKYIITLCLVLSLVLPSTAFAVTPTANFKPSVTAGYAPLKVKFTYTGSTAGVIAHKWTYGDGASCQTCWRPSHTYTKPGTYKATLTLRTAKGSSTKSCYITVKKR
jgi:PKD repeat protein